MPTSQNGWTANDRSKVSSRLVPGTSVRLTVRNGSGGDLLLEVAGLFDRLVQDIDNARGFYNPAGELDDWGYAERPIRGTTTVPSNHASGTAIDLNATRWPLGKPASINLNTAQIAQVNRILAAANGCVRWGANYTGRKDPMHFELVTTSEAQCRAAIDNLRRVFGGTTAAPSPIGDVSREDDPAMRIDIRPDESGAFYETVVLDGGKTAYVAQSHLLLASERGKTRFVITARNGSGTEKALYGWDYTLPSHGFVAIGPLDPATRLLVIEGKVDGAGVRPAATLLLKAAA